MRHLSVILQDCTVLRTHAQTPWWDALHTRCLGSSNMVVIHEKLPVKHWWHATNAQPSRSCELTVLFASWPGRRCHQAMMADARGMAASATESAGTNRNLQQPEQKPGKLLFRHPRQRATAPQTLHTKARIYHRCTADYCFHIFHNNTPVVPPTYKYSMLRSS